MRTDDVVYYRKNGGYFSFAYNGYVKTYLYYTLREAYRLFKRECGITAAKLINDQAPITYGFLR